jgi:hypothetical protein
MQMYFRVENNSRTGNFCKVVEFLYEENSKKSFMHTTFVLAVREGVNPYPLVAPG